MEQEYQRIILLNRLVSVAKSRAPDEYKPPTTGAVEIIELLEAARKAGSAFEYWRGEDADDDETRHKNGINRDLIRLTRTRIEEEGAYKYATLLFEYIKDDWRSFPVVHRENFKGRELTGDTQERGAVSAHVVIRIPNDNQHDDGAYRCAIEVNQPITRRDIEYFFSRQLRRISDKQEWTFTVQQKKGKKSIQKEYRYHAKLEFWADVGRSLGAIGSEISHMIFTKRAERHSIGKSSVTEDEEFYASVDIRVNASQGPDTPTERKAWLARIKDYYREQGYETRLYFRHVGGGTASGEVHQAVAGAADLVMCPKEQVTLEKAPKRWSQSINAELVEEMKKLLDRNAVWQRTQ